MTHPPPSLSATGVARTKSARFQDPSLYRATCHSHEKSHSLRTSAACQLAEGRPGSPRRSSRFQSSACALPRRFWRGPASAFPLPPCLSPSQALCLTLRRFFCGPVTVRKRLQPGGEHGRTDQSFLGGSARRCTPCLETYRL